MNRFKTIPLYLFILCACIFVLNSCHHDSCKDNIKDPSPYFTNFFTGNDEDVLRGVNFNVTADEIKKKESSKLYESTADHLFYEFSYPTDSTAFSEYANVQYFFNEDNELDIITADIYLNDSVQEGKLRNNITAYFTLRYGKPDTDENDHPLWTGSFTDKKSEKKYNYTVALKELADDFGVSLEYVRE